jgi:hypothetical protein
MKLQTSTFYVGLLLLLCAGITQVHGQSLPAKFGKLEDAELTMRVYDPDTSAAAVVLSDVGKTYFTYNNGFKLMFERHTRIKILKKSGYEWANVSVPYYQKNSDKERVSAVKGYTYNMEGGKVVKHKLESGSLHEEQRSENWFAKKFTMPNVKEGSVIEYSYTISSDFMYNMREWEFQTTIPTVWSEYNTRIPEYFNYKQLQQGYLPFHISESHRGNERFTVVVKGEKPVGRTSVPVSSAEHVEAPNTISRWVMKDVPALKEESFITTLRDYQAKIEFELQYVKYPGEAPQTMTGNWSELTKKLMQEERFGSQLNRKGFFKNEVAAIVAQHNNPEQQMVAIHELVKRTVKWDGKYGIYTSNSLRKSFENKSGSAAEINLLLTAMLLEAGLDASPVLVSTREHGRPPKGSPMLNKFNYVVTHVKIGDKEHLLDATDPLLPAGMLPVRCLNGEGRLMKVSDPRWVDLVPAGMYTKLFNGQLTIHASGEMVGKATESSSGYNAFRLRKAILDEGEEKYAEKISKEIGNFKIGKPTFVNVNELGKSLNIDYSLTSSGSGQPVDVIYLNPMMGQGEKENPFNLENRVYPIDLAVPIDHTYICRFILPDGYEVEETPKGAVVSLPENGGKFMYMIERQGNTLQIMSKISILKPVYYAPEYPYLKEFYNQIVAKHAEQIVLKKTAK